MSKNISKKNYNMLMKVVDKIYTSIIKDISVKYNINLEDLKKN